MSKKSVSVTRLENLRLASGKSLSEFLESLTEYNTVSPSNNFKDLANSYYEHHKDMYKLPKTSGGDINKTHIENIFSKGMSPIKGELERITSSRKYGEGFYAVKIKLNGSNSQTVTFNMNDLSDIRITVSGIEVGNTINYQEVLDSMSETSEQEVKTEPNPSVEYETVETNQEDEYADLGI